MTKTNKSTAAQAMASQSLYIADRGKKKLKMVVGSHSFCKRLREICGLRLDFRGWNPIPVKESDWMNEIKVLSDLIFALFKVFPFSCITDKRVFIILMIITLSWVWFLIAPLYMIFNSFFLSFLLGIHIVLACLKVKVLLSTAVLS